MAATTPGEIAKFIAQRDRAFQPLIASVGPPPVRRSIPVDDRFASLVRCITFQLLATSAANTIHTRVIAACNGEVTVSSVLKAGSERLRQAGLSQTKSSAMLELANSVANGQVSLGRHGRMSNDEITADVTAVRGIGPWTAHMYLMHSLARGDVWPAGDYGVRNGWSILHHDDEMISESALKNAGEPFIGVRSSVAWYCWQAVHQHRLAR